MTAQVQKWLESADEEAIARLKRFIAQGRIGLSGLEFNTTPLCSAEQFVKQLEPVKKMRLLLGADIRTANQHDVDGIPWSAVDLLADAGIELLIMAVNIHLGGPVAKRPSVFRWQGPSGREILVMNGAHYTMFDQLLYTWENSIERMQEGLAHYLGISGMAYAHDFIYLTTAATPVCWDNSPPPRVARLIRGVERPRPPAPDPLHHPNELLERIKLQPRDQYELLRGDWTDYWNFGCASTADVTRISRRAKQKTLQGRSARIFGAGTPAHYAGLPPQPGIAQPLRRTHLGLLQLDGPGQRFLKAQAAIKDHHAWQGHELAGILLVDRLEAFSGNAADATPEDRRAQFQRPAVREFVRIPEAWRAKANACAPPASAGMPEAISPPRRLFTVGGAASIRLRFHPLWGAERGGPRLRPAGRKIVHESAARRLNTLEKDRRQGGDAFHRVGILPP